MGSPFFFCAGDLCFRFDFSRKKINGVAGLTWPIAGFGPVP